MEHRNAPGRKQFVDRQNVGMMSWRTKRCKRGWRWRGGGRGGRYGCVGGWGEMMTVKHADGTNRPFKPVAANANEISYLSVADKLFTLRQHSCVFVSFRTTADERWVGGGGGGVNLQIEQQGSVCNACYPTSLLFHSSPVCFLYKICHKCNSASFFLPLRKIEEAVKQE